MMKTTQKDNYLLVEDEKENVDNFVSYLEEGAYKTIQNHHLVIDILKYKTLTLEELLSFLPLSNRHRAQKKSFVIVNDTINIDEIPEELIVVPTLLEAGDIIQMEEIERDLESLE